MDTQLVKTILTQKEPVELYNLVQPALESTELRDLLVEGCFSKDETFRYNCVRVFFRALKQQPALFYPYWGSFAGMLDSPNSFYRSTATQAIAFLTAVDDNRKLDAILDAYLRMFDDDKFMVARYFVQTIHLLPEARPDLSEKVVACLLDVEDTRHTESRKSLLKADIIGAFKHLFENSSTPEQMQMMAFVEKEMDSESPSTRKAAKAFLKKDQQKWSNGKGQTRRSTMSNEGETTKKIMALESAALERWGNGDPSGFLEICASDVVYFDPYQEIRIDGLEALTQCYKKIWGQVHFDRFELLNPCVQLGSELAVLTFNYVSYIGEKQSRWNCTEVYRQVGVSWEIIQTHWSYTRHPGIVQN